MACNFVLIAFCSQIKATGFLSFLKFYCQKHLIITFNLIDKTLYDSVIGK